ncbi:plasmid stabilization system family protein [Asticcacaulis biprosthecium C19]|uniref:Plasmid stabilization system family protein n=1 Tax=Asticcacaulis biprosthecium C19 TaxID=715226 RepID=F4QS77_9CAUL|nr:type II toxin-antitoxin system RelE/ParE family toxin [Asticcacaulis biprosthecium]EGF89597.1 plasmid stabilization system family protein [Asticcacaulis biprosthecium C19]
MRRVKYLRQAEQDLFDIFDYIATESGQVRIAAAFTEALVDRCDSLAFLPGKLGHPRDDLAPGLRSLSHKTYLIFFQYVEDVIEIVTIIHGMRDIDAMLSDD